MINETKFNKVVETAKSKTNDAKWLRAIERAAAGILDGTLIVTTIDDAHSLVTSANGSYWTNGRCSCRAAQVGHRECHHRAAAQLWKRYEEAIYAKETAPVTVSRATIIADIKSTFASKFPGYNLTATVNALCGPYSVEMLGAANLRHVLNAIA